MAKSTRNKSNICPSGIVLLACLGWGDDLLHFSLSAGLDAGVFRKEQREEVLLQQG